MSAAKNDGWTAHELVAELRERERRAGAGAGNRAAKPMPRRRSADVDGSLDAIPTGELARLAKAGQRAVYGVDDRKDMFQVSKPAVLAAARAVVALVKAVDLRQKPDGSYDLATEPYRDAYDLCASEPFADQPLGCFCSGFLVAPDVVATAGHCVKTQAQLAGIRFVFDFKMTGVSSPRTSFPASDVYRGTTLMGHALDDATGTDWALVRLDRAVQGRTPVKMRTSGKVPAGQKLYVVGHPCGLPQKYAPGAEVRDNTPAPYFVANLDTYGGNSGSPVFNATNNQVEGILVRGETDFVSNGNCNVSLVCPSTGCRGEDVTRTSVFVAKVPKAKAARKKLVARRKRSGGAK